MEKITNIKDIKRGESLVFKYKNANAVLVRAKDAQSSTSGELVAYVAVCPHESGNIEWDEQIKKLVCECHLSLFNIKDGSVYKHSSLFELTKGLTKIDLKVDDKHDIYAV
jgi:nitrite reductase/ring-hydroxylating ferredoxin subunit